MTVRRLQLTMVYEFAWAADELKGSDADRLAGEFLKDPYGFLNLEFPEWDEIIYVNIEDVTDNA